MKIKFIDYDEHALVVTVTREGATSVVAPLMCDSSAADVLRKIADQLDAAHPPYPCTPGAYEPDPQHEHAELGTGGTLDAERRVWTDGTGHVWDLAATWGDAAGLRWRWTGQLTSSGIPWMRAGDDVDEQPLDVVRTVHGPIAPTAGERS
ncbi:phiSA1p31-related protein [Streptomyces niveus]|uniref:phiSA1p31-related protein n=1 Tax=Streptomyces niveus TaxID=193462 RepID=UPI00341BA6F0